MGNTEATEGGAGRGRYELWVHFGNWTGEPGMGTPGQVAEDYGLEYERFEGGAGVVSVWDGASETDARYEGWELVRAGGVARVEVRAARGALVGTWSHSGQPDDDGFDTLWTPA